MKEIVTLTTEILLEGLLWPESPRWHNDKLWFSDMDAHKVMTVDLNGNTETILEIPNRTSGLGWLPDDRMLIVSMENCRILRLDPEGVTEHANLIDLATLNCNDMVVDEKGRAYVGNMGFDFFSPNPKFTPAEIILVTPEGDAKIAADDMAFPNGMVITPDGKNLIVAENFARRITKFNIMEDGSLIERRIWAKTRSIAPDGICLDAEGAIWSSAPGRHRAVRILEGGKITHEVKIETDAYACMLGGPKRDILFIATSTAERVKGRIEYVKVDIPGAGLP